MLDHLGVGRVALCGVSFGGRIALETALDDPDRIGALVDFLGSVSAAGVLRHS